MEIPELMKILNITEQEAKELQQFDKEVDKDKSLKDPTLTKEQEKAIKKVTNTSKVKSVDAYGKARVREKKIDKPKENIISQLADTIKNQFDENVQITNISKTIEFNLNNEHYVIDLKRSRKK